MLHYDGGFPFECRKSCRQKLIHQKKLTRNNDWCDECSDCWNRQRNEYAERRKKERVAAGIYAAATEL